VLETEEDTLAVIAAIMGHNGIVARSSYEVARLSGENMKIGALLFSLVLAGCFGPGPPAPDYALGTYQGEAMGGASCPSPAADVTVTVAKYSAFGDWYLKQQNTHTQFACATVDQIGFYGSHDAPRDGMEYVIGYFTNEGSAIDARISTGTCSYTGRLSRARSMPYPIQGASIPAHACMTHAGGSTSQ
jgi:hypothetical protein